MAIGYGFDGDRGAGVGGVHGFGEEYGGGMCGFDFACGN